MKAGMGMTTMIKIASCHRASAAVRLRILCCWVTVCVVVSASITTTSTPFDPRSSSYITRGASIQEPDRACSKSDSSAPAVLQKLLRFRGGGTLPFEEQWAAIQIQEVVLALRWTAEMNRRLVRATRIDPSLALPEVVAPALSSYSSAPAFAPSVRPFDVLLRGGSSELVQTVDRIRSPEHRFPLPHHSFPASPEFKSKSDSLSMPLSHLEPVLTVFHAKIPRARVNSRTASVVGGAARWGPELSLFLKHLIQVMSHNMSDNDDLWSFRLALALVYLDRASSVETPRSRGVPPVPFLTPRTTHRLVVSALLLAVQMTANTTTTINAVPGGYITNDINDIHPHNSPSAFISAVTIPATAAAAAGESTDLYARVATSLGLPLSQLYEMTTWMMGALGDPGRWVTPEQWTDFHSLWESTFGTAEQTRPLWAEGSSASP